MISAPDLIELSKLETRFLSDPDCTQHITYTISPYGIDRRRARREESWKRKKRLGQGAFGTVWLEECVQGEKKKQLRAVKEVSRSQAQDVNRELQAAALFSYPKVLPFCASSSIAISPPDDDAVRIIFRQVFRVV